MAGICTYRVTEHPVCHHRVSAIQAKRDNGLDTSYVKIWPGLADGPPWIRTPPNAISGMTGLLLDTTLDKDQLDCVETMWDSGEVLTPIINNILDFTK